jgi:hypothetical protein
MVDNLTWINYFPLYANKPIANELADLVKQNNHVHITIEGQLKTYMSKKTKEWKISIQINKILGHK